MTNAVEKKMGRPTSYNERLAARLLELATNGATDEEMSRIAGVSTRTFTTWKKQYPDFLLALNECKDVADQLVEATLYQRAVGFKQPAIKIFCTQNGGIKTHRYIEHVTPCTTAQIFWLKNRQPERWRDVHKIDISAEVKLVLPTPQEAKQILDADYAVLPAPEVKVEDL